MVVPGTKMDEVAWDMSLIELGHLTAQAHVKAGVKGVGRPLDRIKTRQMLDEIKRQVNG